MTRAALRSPRPRYASLLLILCACSAPKPIPGVVVREPGQELTSLPGPMPNFGPLKTAADAVFAACPLILSQPW